MSEAQNEMQVEMQTPQPTEQDVAQPVVEPPQAQAAADLEERLRQAELKAAEYQDAWLRSKAEADNIRRRAQEDVEKARKFALEKFAGELLAVKDSLEAALAVGEAVTLESMKSGVELTLKQLSGVFVKNNVLEINPVGEKFDPHAHQAISMVEGQGEPNTVASVLQKGYLLNDRVLRPALVIVNKS